MKRTLRLASVFLLVLLASVLVSLPVFAYLFTAPITIQETNGTAYAQIGVQDDLATDWLINHGYMDANALDTAVSPTKPHMVAQDRLLLATPLPAFGLVNVNFTTGNTPVASMDIVTGYNGYVTANDVAAWELGAAGEYEFDGYVNTATAGSILISKPRAISTYISVAGTISAGIHTTTSPVSSASDGHIYGENANYAVTKALAVATGIDVGGGSSYIGQAIPANYFIYRSAFYFDTSGIPDDALITGATLRLYGSIDSSVQDFDMVITNGQPTYPHDPLVVADFDETFYNGNGGSLTTAGFSTIAYNDIELNATGLSWISKTATTKLLVRSSRDIAGNPPIGDEYVLVQTSEGANDPTLVVYYVPASVSVATVSGKHTVKTTVTAAGGGTITLDVDGTTDSQAGVGAVPDTAYDWTLMSNSLPYLNYYLHTVGGVPVGQYQPNNVIRGEAYSTGTVTVTNGDATVEGAGGAVWTETMEGSVFLSADGLYYTIDSVTDADTLELTAVYAGGTLAGQTYNFYPRLPDREGALQDGAITWGANPAGVAMAIASFSGYSGSFVDSPEEEPPADRLPEVPVSDWYGDNTVTKAATLANPIRPFVTMVSDNTTLTEIQAWRMLGMSILIGVAVLISRLARGHQGITAIATGAIIALLIAFDGSIFPLYLAILSAGLIIGGLVSERSHQL